MNTSETETTFSIPEFYARGKQALQAGQLDDARHIFEQLAETLPNELELLFNLSQVERQSQQWAKALAWIERAYALAPAHPLIREQRATLYMLTNEGKHMQTALDSFAEILRDAPQSYAVAGNLITLALRSDAPHYVLNSITPLLALPELLPTQRLRFTASVSIAAYLSNDTAQALEMAEAALALRPSAEQHPTEADLPFLLIYASFIRDLLQYRKEHPELYAAAPKQLHIVGESHCLTAAAVILSSTTEQGEAAERRGGEAIAEGEGSPLKIIPHLHMGAKAYFYSLPEGESWQYQLAACIQKLPESEPLLLTFGEIDCRVEGSIMRHLISDSNYPLESELEGMIARYVAFVKQATQSRSGKVCIAGVPAPCAALQKHLDDARKRALPHLIASFNAHLSQHAATHNLGFVDVYQATLGDGGWAREGVHLDTIHLTPAVMAEAIQAAL